MDSHITIDNTTPNIQIAHCTMQLIIKDQFKSKYKKSKKILAGSHKKKPERGNKYHEYILKHVPTLWQFCRETPSFHTINGNIYLNT